jgi:hypothetical protein
MVEELTEVHLILLVFHTVFGSPVVAVLIIHPFGAGSLVAFRTLVALFDPAVTAVLHVTLLIFALVIWATVLVALRLLVQFLALTRLVVTVLVVPLSVADRLLPAVIVAFDHLAPLIW